MYYDHTQAGRPVMNITSLMLREVAGIADLTHKSRPTFLLFL